MKFPYSTHAITPFSHRVRLHRRRVYFDSIRDFKIQRRDGDKNVA